MQINFDRIVQDNQFNKGNGKVKRSGKPSLGLMEVADSIWNVPLESALIEREGFCFEVEFFI